MNKNFVWIGILAALSISGCSLWWGPDGYEMTPAKALGLEKVVTLDQGWNGRIRMESWHKDQGSRILPTKMFLKLEQADSKKLFQDHANIARYRYVPQEPDSEWNPEGLPLGFTSNGEVMGITCSACHSTMITYKGTGMLIDGAPTMADFQTFFQDLTTALERTRDDSAKFKRFAGRMLGGNAKAGKIKGLRKELDTWAGKLRKRETLNKTTYPYGYARVDAFGQIFNAVSSANMKPEELAKANKAQPDAPVSYPFLWGTPQSDRVQWNGIARNRKPIPKVPGQKRKKFGKPKLAGPLGRNVGEVLGVFGNITVKPRKRYEIGTIKLKSVKGYKSSVKIVNIAILERWLKTLKPPPWPQEIFGPLDAEKIKRGKKIYGKRCAGCHQLVKPLKRYNAKFIPLRGIGTDPTMAENALTKAGTGFLEGQRISYILGDKFEAKAPKAKLLKNQVIGTLVGDKKETLVAIGIEKFDYTGAESLREKVKEIKERLKAVKTDDLDDRLAALSTPEPKDELRNYKARPLNGIWATAPFLHNGSVPTLYDLLLPEERRPKTFSLGGWEYDPIKVGYAPYTGPNAFVFNTAPAVKGNSNKGHPYADKPKKLSDEQRWAVVEYLKSL